MSLQGKGDRLLIGDTHVGRGLFLGLAMGTSFLPHILSMGGARFSVVGQIQLPVTPAILSL